MKSKIIVFVSRMIASIVIIACSNNADKGKSETQKLDTNKSYEETLSLFKTSESRLTKEREINQKKNILITPLDEAIFFYETISKFAPKLINDIAFYRKDLLNVLKDSTIVKNEEFNKDVVRLLYNTSIEEYSVIIDSLYIFYKNKQIDFATLECSILQNNHLSMLVILNCKNSKLRNVLSVVRQNQEPSHHKLNKEIDDILNCNDLKSAEEMNRYQPPFFKSLN